MDPLTVTAAISVASRAFAGVKKMVEMGKEAHIRSTRSENG